MEATSRKVKSLPTSVEDITLFVIFDVNKEVIDSGEGRFVFESPTRRSPCLDEAERLNKPTIEDGEAAMCESLAYPLKTELIEAEEATKVNSIEFSNSYIV